MAANNLRLTDPLVSDEDSHMSDRFSSLEHRVLRQEDEIICLKSALADCLRRLATVETHKATHNSLPSKPSVRTAKAVVSRLNTTRDGPKEAAIAPTRVLSSHATPKNTSTKSPGRMNAPRPAGSAPSLYKHPQRTQPATSPVNLQAGEDLNSASNGASKDGTPDSDDGMVRFSLRGKALTFHAPTEVADTADLGKAPVEKLKLEWAYGYRGKDARSNLFLLPTGEIVYFVAAVVVLHNVEEQTQRHYLGHTDDIKCLAVHPDRVTIATGQMAGHDKKEGKPHIRVWDTVNLNTLKVIGLGEFERAVVCISFSQMDGGKHLSAVDDANDHVLSVWDWQKGDKGVKLAEIKSSQDPVLAIDYHPCEANTIISCGKSQISFWHLEGGSLSRKQGLFERNDKPRFVTCLAFATNGDVLSGDSSGNFYVWGRGTAKISVAHPATHEGGLFSICVCNDGRILTGGGRDRRIVEWDSDYQPTGREHEIPELYGGIRMLSQGKGNMILVGTTKNCVLQGTLDLKFSPIVQGHNDELWGLAVHPSQHQLLTCGSDKLLILWDCQAHSAVWMKELTDAAQCVAFHPEGNVATIGFTAHKWQVIDLSTRDMIATFSDGTETFQCGSYSPDGSMLAMGNRDNHIYVYSVTEAGLKYSRVGKCSGHSSFILHLDWSKDSKFIRSNSGDYELLFWHALTCRQMTNTTEFRDTEWNTYTCPLTYSTYGIWPEGADGTDINACSKANDKALLATADDFGKLNLYRYPSSVTRSESASYQGHSSHVTNVQFLYDDSRVLTVGGKDTAVLQWYFV